MCLYICNSHDDRMKIYGTIQKLKDLHNRRSFLIYNIMLLKKEDFRINEDLFVEYFYKQKVMFFLKKEEWILYPYWRKFENKEDAEKAIEKEIEESSEYNIHFIMPVYIVPKCHGYKMTMNSFSILTGYNKNTYHIKDTIYVSCYCGNSCKYPVITSDF